MQADGGDDIKALQKQLDVIKVKIERLYDAIEDGCVANDEDTKTRMDALKQKRAEIAAKIENYSHSPQAMLDEIDKAEIKQWSALLREQLSAG